MPKYAHYLPGVPQPTAVLGWYDTDMLTYPNMPPDSELIELTDAEWAEHFGDPNGWGVKGGAIVPFTQAPPASTPAQQATAALNSGCQIVSTSEPALDGTYAIDAETRSDMLAEVVSLGVNGKFTNGSATLAWPDMHRQTHTFDPVHFTALATAIGGYVGALKGIINSDFGTLPTQPVQIG